MSGLDLSRSDVVATIDVAVAKFSRRDFKGIVETCERCAEANKMLIRCKCTATFTISFNSKGHPRLDKFVAHLAGFQHGKWKEVKTTLLVDETRCGALPQYCCLIFCILLFL